MEENNIEEDIKYIEDVIALAIALPTGEVKMQEEEIEAMQRILSDYKRLQEEFKQVDHECDRLEQKEIKLEKENVQLKEDIKEMYYKEAVITIMCDNFNLSRNEVLELLGDEE